MVRILKIIFGCTPPVALLIFSYVKYKKERNFRQEFDDYFGEFIFDGDFRDTDLEELERIFPKKFLEDLGLYDLESENSVL